MLTKEQIKTMHSNTLDGRDMTRLCDFFDHSEWATFGCTLANGATPPAPTPYTEENVKAQLAKDVAFGFDKALHRRGISASMMYNVVKMWMVVLEDDMKDHGDYAQYGLPLFRAVAVKYGLENPIGDDIGNESKYAQ